MFAALLAKQLDHLLMVLVTDSLKGHAQMSMLIHPALPVAGHLAALLRAGADNLADTHTSSYAGVDTPTSEPDRTLRRFG